MDTVYGLCADPYREEPVRELYRMKQRPAEQPMALLAKDVDFLVGLVPELRDGADMLVRALLPGPFTLVLPNPGERFRWLTGSTPDRIGVRVPDHAVAQALLEELAEPLLSSTLIPAGETEPLNDPQAIRDRYNHALELIIDSGPRWNM